MRAAKRMVVVLATMVASGCALVESPSDDGASLGVDQSGAGRCAVLTER